MSLKYCALLSVILVGPNKQQCMDFVLAFEYILSQHTKQTVHTSQLIPATALWNNVGCMPDLWGLNCRSSLPKLRVIWLSQKSEPDVADVTISSGESQNGVNKPELLDENVNN